MPKVLEMDDLFDPEEVNACAAIFAAAASPAEALAAWQARKDTSS